MELFPKIEPYKSGYLLRNDGHKVYWECCGNPQGKPIMHVHGGPGAGADEEDRRYYDPEKWNVIMSDQRGAGRSVPAAATENNTTPHLTQDIDTLLNMLGISKTVLSGGSWGSTLSLTYAIQHPERVTGLVLNGVFLANKEDTTLVTKGGCYRQFPEVWAKLLNIVPSGYNTENAATYYHSQMTGGDQARATRFAKEWVKYVISISRLNPPSPEELEKELQEEGETILAHALFEAHYSQNGFFLPEDNYILRHAHRIPRVPITFVHGRYDALCPLSSVYTLKNRLHAATKLRVVVSGHSRKDVALRSAILEEIDAMWQLV